MDPANVGELAWRSARLFPNATAVLQDDVTVSYAELDDRIRRVSTLVRLLGARTGDRVLILLPNDWRYAEVLLGTAHGGAVATPMNSRLSADMLAYVARHSGGRMLLTHTALAQQAAALGIEQTHFVDAPEWLASIDPAPEAAPVDPGEPAALMYTSGSTGRPNGVLIAHRSQWWQSRTMARCFLLTEADLGLVTGPLYHANALWACLLPALYTGASVAVMPSWSAESMLAAVNRYRPTFTSGTPAMFTLLLHAWEDAPDYDLSSLEMLVCGSAPVPSELLETLKRRLGGVDVLEGYGLTEGGANIMTPRWGIHKPGSTGLPLPGVEIEVRDPDDPTTECDADQVGELWTRSEANLIGYLNDSDLTAARLTPDNWLRTGDLVRRDEQGYVYFSGRTDDMINVGGENVYPKEVESILLEHPDVRDVCVVAVAHRLKGSAPVAWVVSHNPHLQEEDIKRFFLVRGPAYAHPRRVFFVDALPVTGTNKLDRRLLRDNAVRIIGGAPL